jgi:hypothetical protein
MILPGGNTDFPFYGDHCSAHSRTQFIAAISYYHLWLPAYLTTAEPTFVFYIQQLKVRPELPWLWHLKLRKSFMALLPDHPTVTCAPAISLFPSRSLSYTDVCRRLFDPTVGNNSDNLSVHSIHIFIFCLFVPSPFQGEHSLPYSSYCPLLT